MDDSVEEIESVKSETENQFNISGSNEGVKIRDDVSLMNKPKDDPIPDSGNSPSSVPSKGKGLRKWRRIKRDAIKDGSGSVDSSIAGKRGLSNSAPNLARGQKSEGSLSSTGAVVRNLGNEMNGSIFYSNLVLKAVNSEISEDQSSISSTAASGSMMRNRPAFVAVTSGKKGANGVKVQAKSKKARGEREKIEKESSITSSLESDSRSSNFVFALGTDSGDNNGKYSVKIGNGLGENSEDEAREGEKCIIGEVENCISKENGRDLEDLVDVENQGLAESDPLAESISQLQSAQEAFEKEIRMLRELGDESQRTTEEDAHEACSSQLFNLENNTEISTHYLKAHVNTLKQNVNVSESKLEEANGILNTKEAKETKVEYEDIEAEIEDLFKRKFEEEFQYLVISKTLEKLKIDVGDQVAISDELKTTLNVVRDTRTNLNMLKRRAEKLETYVEETAETEEVSKLQSVRQVTSCFFVQSILLILVFISFVLNLSPDNAGVVPT